jgi:hypothetical protein
MNRACLWVTLVVSCIACGRSANHGPGPESPTVSVAGGDTPQALKAPPAAQGATGHGVAGTSTAPADTPADIGAPKTFDNLTVFPVTSKFQDELGPLTTLDDALAKKAAAVRETGADDQGRVESAQVNALVIENKGTVPIYVLAGTVVKGGKQDRQIGQDFIIGAHQTIPVDAFCIEPGRWTADRNGVATGGQFGSIGILTPSDVRAAAEYHQNQSEVWSKVGEVNAANRKSAASGTLLATIDSADIVEKRTALAGKVDGYLKGVQPGDAVVGFAYAVDGKVRSVRYFANHKVFEMFRTTLVNTAAMDAITAQSVAAASGHPAAAPPPVAPAAVSQFIKDAESGDKKSDRDTPAANMNTYQASDHAYESRTMLKAGPSPAGQPPAKPKPVSKSVNSL